MADEIEELRGQIAELETKLLESEHRWTHIIRNWVSRNQWSEDDPKRKASSMAILWRVLAPTTVAFSLGTGGLGVALYTAHLFRQQNTTLVELNTLTTRQFEAESTRRKLQRKTELIGVLWNVREVQGEADEYGEPLMVPVASAVHRREASIEYVELLKELGEEISLGGARLDGVSSTAAWNLKTKDHLRGANLTGAQLTVVDLTGADLYGVNLRGAVLGGANLFGMGITIAGLSDANLENTELASTIKVALTKAILAGADLAGADRARAHLARPDLIDAYLLSADLTGANLGDSDLRGADLRGANLTGANLTGAEWNNETAWPKGFTPPDSAFFLPDPDPDPPKQEPRPQDKE